MVLTVKVVSITVSIPQAGPVSFRYRPSIKGFQPMHLVGLSFTISRFEEESGYFLAIRGIASNAGN